MYQRLKWDSCHEAGEAGGARAISHPSQSCHYSKSVSLVLPTLTINCGEGCKTDDVHERFGHAAQDAGQDVRGAFGPMKSSVGHQRAAIMTPLLLELDYYGLRVSQQLMFDNGHPKIPNE